MPWRLNFLPLLGVELLQPISSSAESLSSGAPEPARIPTTACAT
jgi:hypothetical protein